MPKVNIDGTVIEVENGTTLLQACEMVGAEIPRFCYHERLSIAGNCRMCLVEVKGAPKPQVSCGVSVNDLRPGPEGQPPEVFTRTPTVKKAREGVMEFLLINHPLDCPVCDQGGECDLQDQAMAYGIDQNRFHENKRAVEDKYIGPLIRTFMNRCIQCTRCIRFSSEVAGIDELGAIGRGEDMEITTYLERAMVSELQGNVIDLCPVGALVSAPYSMKARPWELRKTESVDVMDALGAAIRVDVRDRRVMRILPRRYDEVNEEWISDKSRFIWDGLMTQRLDRPYVREGGRLRPASWGEAFGLIAERFKAAGPEATGCLMGDLAGVEEMFALKSLMRSLDVKHVDCREPHSPLGEAGGRAGFLFNATVAGIEQADAILIVGSNPRLESAVLNARIRKVWRANGVPIGVIGENADLTYPYRHLGAGPQSLVELLDGKGPFAKVLEKAERPLIIVGQGAIARPDGKAVLARAARLALQCGAVREEWNGFSVLHTAAARAGGLEVCALPASEGGMATADILAAAKAGDIAAVYLLGVDEIDMAELGDAFVVYQGTHGDAGAHRADVVLPGAAYTEKSATFVNTEGRPQMTRRGAFPPGDARDDWAIVRALSDVLGATLPFDTLDQLRARLYESVPHLAAIDSIEPADPGQLSELAEVEGDVAAAPFASPVTDYFLTNPIARASRIMGECSALRAGLRLEAAE
jgi:NADH-quinone oxidoreductase subunit G